MQAMHILFTMTERIHDHSSSFHDTPHIQASLTDHPGYSRSSTCSQHRSGANLFTEVSRSLIKKSHTPTANDVRNMAWEDNHMPLVPLMKAALRLVSTLPSSFPPHPSTGSFCMASNWIFMWVPSSHFITVPCRLECQWWHTSPTWNLMTHCREEESVPSSLPPIAKSLLGGLRKRACLEHWARIARKHLVYDVRILFRDTEYCEWRDSPCWRSHNDLQGEVRPEMTAKH